MYQHPSDSPATNPESAVAPWEFARSMMRHLGNSKVEVGALGSLSGLGKNFAWHLKTWETVIQTVTTLGKLLGELCELGKSTSSATDRIDRLCSALHMAPPP